MPWTAQKRGGKWVVLNKDGKVVSHHKTEAKARASIRARYANTDEFDEAYQRAKGKR